MNTFKMYAVSNLQIYNTALLAIVAILYITSPGPIYLITGYLHIDELITDQLVNQFTNEIIPQTETSSVFFAVVITL